MRKMLTFFSYRRFYWENLHIQDYNEKAGPSALSDVMKTWVEDISMRRSVFSTHGQPSGYCTKSRVIGGCFGLWGGEQ